MNDLIAALRKKYPHGHKEFIDITLSEIALHSAKNHDYASGGAVLGNFDRVSAILALYPGLRLSDRRVVLLTYMLKQVDAILWGISAGIAHRVEGLSARLQDVSVYAKILMCIEHDDREKS